jgi:hypothetical protein
VARIRVTHTKTYWRFWPAVVTATVAVMLAVQPASASPTPQGPTRTGRHKITDRHVGVKPPTNLTPIDTPDGTTLAERQAMAAAAAKAHATGRPVTVDIVTNETGLLVAQPSGGFTLSATPGPVRTRQHGAWVPVSTVLGRNRDGTWSPAATAYGTVRFSGGGSGPLAVTRSGGVTYAVRWPVRLPAPTVSGAMATYHNALGSGIDLVVSATDTGGFSDTVVIRTAKAAKNPALAALHLSTVVSGGTQRAGLAADGLLVSGNADMVLESSTPQMWDSNIATAGAKTAAGLAPDRSDIGHPGLGARVATVHTDVSTNGLALVPDSRMLHDPSTVFPVYMDPTTNWHLQDANSPSFDEIKSGSPCNGASYFNNTGSAGNFGLLGVGWNGWNEGCNGVEHAMYQWRIPTAIWGATINLATVNATEVYASQCSTTSTINLHETGGIGSGTDWNNRPGYTGKYSTSASYAAAENPNFCPNQDNVTHAFTVTSRMATAAAQHWSQWTIALTNDADERSHNRNGFKRFAKDPVLAINYDHSPDTPTAAVMAAKSASTNVACATAAPYPVMGKTIVSNTPTLNTVVTDRDSDKTQATFKYWVDGSTTTHTGLSADNLTNKSMATFSLPTSFVSTLTNGQVVDWQAQVSDGLVPPSGWSTVCHFSVLPVGPDAPIIQPNSTYPDSSDPATAAAVGMPAGTTATWNVAGAGTGAMSVKFVYGLDQPPATSNPPASQVRPPMGTVLATPAGRWRANEGSGTTLADSSGNNHPATLTNGGWATDATRGAVASFNGTSSVATTAGPVLNTSTSYSVSAWVKMTNTTTYNTIVEQAPGNFFLQYNKGANAWSFIVNNTSSGGGQTNAHATTPPVLNVWTHLVGVHDAVAHTLSLYVNGTLAGTASYSTPWASAGPLEIGHAGAGNYFPGQISDVQVYQRALTAANVRSMYSFTWLTATPLAPGPHTLYVYGVDAAGDISTNDAYPFIAAGTPSRTCATLTACFNNTAISPDANPGLANADGAGWSFSATDLANAGWTSGGHITINGAPFTLPAFGSGQADNVMAANQTITYPYAVPGTGLSSLLFLTAATNARTGSPGAIPGNATAPYVSAGTATAGVYCFDSTNPAAYCPAVGTITYTDGSQQSYDLVTPDWVLGQFTIATLRLDHRNNPAGRDSNGPDMYLSSVPLAAGKTVQSVTLPDVGNTTASGSQQLHIFGMSTRNATTGTTRTDGNVTAAPAGKTWTGAWGGAPDGPSQAGGDFNLTLRVKVIPTVSGDTVRIKVDNSLSDGQGPLAIGHATIALADHTRMTDLAFSGSQALTLPEGGMAYSDPLPYPVTAGQPIFVSFSLPGQDIQTIGNEFSDGAYEYATDPGTGDHTRDASEDAFDPDWRATGYGGPSTDVITNLDVTTSGVPTQAVFGDGTIDYFLLNGEHVPSLRTDIASAMTSTPTTYGLVAEDIESNGIMVNQDGYGQNVPALSRIDRDILAQPGITSVILDEGLEDFLGSDITGTLPDSPFRKSADELTRNGYTQLLTYLQANGISVIATGLSPCDGYVGAEPDLPDFNQPCTSAIDGYRTATNAWLSSNPLGMGPWSTPALFYIDADSTLAVPDTTNGEMKLHPGADLGDHVNLTPAGYGALTTAYLGPQDTWQLDDGVNPDDGTIDNTVTAGADTASNANNPFLLNNPATGQNPVSIGTGAVWAVDPTRGGVLSLDGITGEVTAAGPVLDTTASYSVSAWVKLSNLPTQNATVIAQNGTTASAFYLQYNYAHSNAPGWAFKVAQGDITDAPLAGPNIAGATTDWTHLVGVYNAVTHTAQLYVNGVLAGTATGVTGWAATNPLVIGAAEFNGADTDHLPGLLSDVQAWNYALTSDQVTGLYQQIS